MKGVIEKVGKEQKEISKNRPEIEKEIKTKYEALSKILIGLNVSKIKSEVIPKITDPIQKKSVLKAVDSFNLKEQQEKIEGILMINQEMFLF